MKTFLKTLIGGALGIGALYVVGKVCYEAGKDVAEVERQLAEKSDSIEVTGITQDGEQIRMNLDADPIDKTLEHAKAEMADAIDEAWEKNTKLNAIGRAVNKIRNAKMFLAVKKAFGKENRGKGILGSLLTNPDGAKIEAYVRDGGVQINVKPRAA